jgi:FkbM family methyltransferase
MLGRLTRIISYNRDWIPYLWYKYRPPKNNRLLSFRLRAGATIDLKPETRFILNEIFIEGVYDVPGVDLTACRSVLDLGANMGVFAFYAASRAPQATVYCVEPSSGNFEILSRNLRRLAPRAQAFRLAVAGSSGPGFFSLSGNSQNLALSAQAADTERVECVTFARLFELTGSRQFDFVKIDVEGAEIDILKACPDEVLQRVGALAIEWHHSAEEAQTLARRLRSLGFWVDAEPIDGRVHFVKARQASRPQ